MTAQPSCEQAPCDHEPAAADQASLDDAPVPCRTESFVGKSLMEPAREHRHLRAPRADGAFLIDPPVSAAVEALARNSAQMASSSIELQGRRLADLARSARSELLAAALAYTRQYRDVDSAEHAIADPAAPVVLAGHQPQLFHPGVWFKNFVLADVAARAGGTGVNLVIDSDTIKSAALRVPGGTPENPHAESLPLDRASAEIPFEERGVLDLECLRSFGRRAEAVLHPLVPDSLLSEFWPRVVARAEAGAKLGESFAQARHQQEAAWGVHTLELPQSQICGLESFHWFTSHLLAELPVVHRRYNAAVADFRRANHIRSLAHPVPDLAIESSDWLEAPYWIWSSESPRRRRLFVRRAGAELVLTDRAGTELRLERGPEGDASRLVAQLAELGRHGIKLRTRALLTTMFARLLLGDLFLHGIGGAKYDQVTDLLIGRLFEIEPPAYMTVTATQRLPIARTPVTSDDLRLVETRLRELAFHPERYVESGSAEADSAEAGSNAAQQRHWIEEKQRWIAADPAAGGDLGPRERCRQIRTANTHLQPWVARVRQQLEDERRRLGTLLGAEGILASREFAFCLFPAAALRSLMEKA